MPGQMGNVARRVKVEENPLIGKKQSCEWFRKENIKGEIKSA